MPPEVRCEVNPFESPAKIKSSSTPTNAKAQQPDALATTDILFELKQLDSLYSTVEERVQRKRQALKELEHLIFGSNSAQASPRSPTCPTNTPIHSRLRLVSPRLQGLFDLRGPGYANLAAMQSCLDYSPDTVTQIDGNLSTRGDPGHSVAVWVNDEEDALVSPFDDKYALQPGPKKAEKALPAIPCEVESRIPRKAQLRKQGSASRRPAGQGLGGVARGISHRRRTSIRSGKPQTTNSSSELPAKAVARRRSWKRGVGENARTKGGVKDSLVITNEAVKDGARRKEKRKGLWSIYSVCSELGLGGTA